MTRVRDLMHTDVPKIGADATVLEATTLMNKERASGVAVLGADRRMLGVLTDRRLLTTFLPLNKNPALVRVKEIMGPIYRIGPNATPKEAARKIVDNGITRLGVFQGDDFLGWVTLTDVSSYLSKKGLLEALHFHAEPEPSEFLCPVCRSAFMIKVTDAEGDTLRWECPNCHTVL